jgi:hypothetical protein
MNFITPKAAAKQELLFNKPTSGSDSRPQTLDVTEFQL